MIANRRNWIMYLVLFILSTVTFVQHYKHYQPQNSHEKLHYPHKQKNMYLWKQQTLLNLTNFSWSMRNQNTCKSVRNDVNLMPILVHSARTHSQERLAIRRSYGSLGRYKNWAIRVVFLIGQADWIGRNISSAKIEMDDRKLLDEQAAYGDLVIGSFIDSYRNLTYKHMMGFKWVLNYCTNAKLVLKVDDDSFIDVMRWVDRRIEDLGKKEDNSSARIPELYCRVMRNTSVLRSSNYKWFVTVDEWAPNYYPDYCLGCSYGVTVDVIRKMYSLSSNVTFFWIDDVFVSGTLREAVQKKYGLPVEINDISKEYTFSRAYKSFCNRDMWQSTRHSIGVTVRVDRGNLFQRDMMCLYIESLKAANATTFYLKS